MRTVSAPDGSPTFFGDPVLPDGREVGEFVIARALARDAYEIRYLAGRPGVEERVILRELFPRDLVSRALDGGIEVRERRHQELVDRGIASYRDRFAALGTVDHPSIERILATFEANGTAYAASRLEKGQTLDTRLTEDQRLGGQELLDLLTPVLEGLALVHAAGLFHGNITPAHVLVHPDGSAVLLAFATARWLFATSDGVDASVWLPSPYAPIEQLCWRSDVALGPGPDIFALGVLMYRALTGALPPDPLTRSVVLTGEPDPLSLLSDRFGEGLSRPLLSAVEHALAFDVSERPASIGEWLAELRGEPAPPPIGSARPDRRAGSDGGVAHRRLARGLRVKLAALACGGAALGVASYHLLPELGVHVELFPGSLTEVSLPLPPIDSPAPARPPPLAEVPRQSVGPPPVPAALSVSPGEASKHSEASIRRTAPPARPDPAPTTAEPPTTAAVPTRAATPSRDPSSTADAEMHVAQPPVSVALSVPPGEASKHLEASIQRPAPPARPTPAPTTAEPPTTAAVPIRAATPSRDPSSTAEVEMSVAQPPGATMPEVALAKEAAAGAVEGSPAIQAAGKQTGAPRADKIARLLADAAADVQALRLTLPVGNNAIMRYLEVLELEPDNQKALEGVHSVVAKYEQLAHTAAGRGDVREARTYLARAVGVLVRPDLRPFLLGDPTFSARAQALRRSLDQTPSPTASAAGQP